MRLLGAVRGASCACRTLAARSTSADDDSTSRDVRALEAEISKLVRHPPNLASSAQVLMRCTCVVHIKMCILWHRPHNTQSTPSTCCCIRVQVAVPMSGHACVAVSVPLMQSNKSACVCMALVPMNLHLLPAAPLTCEQVAELIYGTLALAPPPGTKPGKRLWWSVSSATLKVRHSTTPHVCIVHMLPILLQSDAPPVQPH